MPADALGRVPEDPAAVPAVGVWVIASKKREARG